MGQLLFTHGYAYTSLALGTLLALLVPVLASLGGWIFFGETLTPHFLAGMLLVFLVCVILGSRETSSVSDLAT